MPRTQAVTRLLPSAVPRGLAPLAPLGLLPQPAPVTLLLASAEARDSRSVPLGRPLSERPPQTRPRSLGSPQPSRGPPLLPHPLLPPERSLVPRTVRARPVQASRRHGQRRPRAFTTDLGARHAPRASRWPRPSASPDLGPDRWHPSAEPRPHAVTTPLGSRLAPRPSASRYLGSRHAPRPGRTPSAKPRPQRLDTPPQLPLRPGELPPPPPSPGRLAPPTRLPVTRAPAPADFRPPPPARRCHSDRRPWKPRSPRARPPETRSGERGSALFRPVQCRARADPCPGLSPTWPSDCAHPPAEGTPQGSPRPSALATPLVLTTPLGQRLATPLVHATPPPYCQALKTLLG